MTYKATLRYLYSKLPMYQRVGKAAFKKDLTNIKKLCDLLGNPQEQFRSIHIAGTNGKGSVTHGLGAILQQTGLKTGLYTSPHYKDFRERIKIDGQFISEEEVIHGINALKPAIDEFKPSFFEITVALAFDYFAKQSVDIAVIETGLGGRLDSTNILQPILSVITNIGYDHQTFLGDTLPLIAGEKAGIIKEGVPVVIGETHPETQDVFIEKAATCQSAIYFADQHFTTTNVQQTWEATKMDVEVDGQVLYPHLVSDLTGSYQLKNICTILQCAELLPDLSIPYCRANAMDALQKVRSSTSFMGRWQVLDCDGPTIIADSAHNVDGLQMVLSQLDSMDYEQLHMVFGAVKDKNLHPVLSLLPTDARYYFCKAAIPRGLPTSVLSSLASKHRIEGQSYASVDAAFQAAKENAGEKDLIFVGGSIFVVAEIL